MFEEKTYRPLADELRPRTLDDVVGQSHILGKGGLLRRIIESKIRKVASGFYGEFREYGLYIFCKDDLTEEEAVMTMEYASELQRHLDVKYSRMYLSQIDRLYVCDLDSVKRTEHKTTCTSYDISRQMCKEFFIKSLM